MTTQTQFDQLKTAGYNLIPVYRQRLADTETPLSVFARLKEHKQAYLFESVEGGENWARYSIIGLGESTVFSCNAGELTIQQADGTIEKATLYRSVPIHLRFSVAVLKSLLKLIYLLCQALRVGLVGYFGYDAVRLY